MRAYSRAVTECHSLFGTSSSFIVSTPLPRIESINRRLGVLARRGIPLHHARISLGTSRSISSLQCRGVILGFRSFLRFRRSVEDLSGHFNSPPRFGYHSSCAFCVGLTFVCAFFVSCSPSSAPPTTPSPRLRSVRSCSHRPATLRTLAITNALFLRSRSIANTGRPNLLHLLLCVHARRETVRQLWYGVVVRPLLREPGNLRHRFLARQGGAPAAQRGASPPAADPRRRWFNVQRTKLSPSLSRPFRLCPIALLLGQLVRLMRTG